MFELIPPSVATDVVAEDAEGDGVGEALSAAGRRPPVTAAPLLEADALAEALAVAVALGTTEACGDGELDADGEAVGVGCGLP